MLLTEIASLVNISTNNQASPDQIAIFMDNIQKSAFQSNTAAFLQYRQKLKIFTVIPMTAGGYTPAIDSDIGKVVNSDHGAIGTLEAFDNEKLEWVVSVSTTSPSDYSAGNTLTITSGTGAATVSSAKQTAYRGPYAAPTSPECRKVWGITRRKPERFWLDFVSQCGLYWINGILNSNDFLAFWGPIAPFETGLNDDLTNEFTFSFDPSFDATYYWVYWRNPPSITDLDDSTQLIIPEAYHSPFAMAVADLAMAFIAREKVDYDAMVENRLGGWIDSLRAPFRDQKLNQNMSQGEQNTLGWGVGGGYYGRDLI